MVSVYNSFCDFYLMWENDWKNVIINWIWFIVVMLVFYLCEGMMMSVWYVMLINVFYIFDVYIEVML